MRLQIKFIYLSRSIYLYIYLCGDEKRKFVFIYFISFQDTIVAIGIDDIYKIVIIDIWIKHEAETVINTGMPWQCVAKLSGSYQFQ